MFTPRFTPQREQQCETIARHMRAIGKKLSAKEIFEMAANRPDYLYRLTVAEINAWTYFREHNHYPSLDEIPDPKPDVTYFIRTKDGRELYRYENGSWIHMGGIPDDVYR